MKNDMSRRAVYSVVVYLVSVTIRVQLPNIKCIFVVLIHYSCIKIGRERGGMGVVGANSRQ